jgi:hypothetical protein
MIMPAKAAMVARKGLEDNARGDNYGFRSSRKAQKARKRSKVTKVACMPCQKRKSKVGCKQPKQIMFLG